MQSVADKLSRRQKDNIEALHQNYHYYN